MKGYRGGSPTAVQAWQPCPVWEPSPSHGKVRILSFHAYSFYKFRHVLEFTHPVKSTFCAYLVKALKNNGRQDCLLTLSAQGRQSPTPLSFPSLSFRGRYPLTPLFVFRSLQFLPFLPSPPYPCNKIMTLFL